MTTVGYIGHKIPDIFETQMSIPPDVFKCAYCSTWQGKVKDVIVRAHKLQQIVSNCCACNAPRTERKEYV